MGDPDDLLLPAGTRLVHIGPHKTGTSALQGALHLDRGGLAAHGVHVAGQPPRPTRAVWAVTGAAGPFGSPARHMSDWDDLVAEIDAAGEDRVVVSNETFALAHSDAIRHIVADLGHDRVHVVGMLRRLDKILPSQWQQMIADGRHRMAYEKWLEDVFSDHARNGFWRRHGYAELTQRWAEGVGTDNVTMVVVDETDRERNLRLFEQFLGLPHRMLQLDDSRENRSLTFGEVEMLRAFNREFHRRGWVDKAQQRFVRGGATPAMKDRTPGADERRIATPRWALERAAEAAERGVEAVRASGVRVIGDLSTLVEPLAAADGPDNVGAPTEIDPEIAALAVAGVVDVAISTGSLPRLYQRRDDDPTPRRSSRSHAGTRPPEDATVRELAQVLRGRVRAALRRSDRPAAGAVRTGGTRDG